MITAAGIAVVVTYETQGLPYCSRYPASVLRDYDPVPSRRDARHVVQPFDIAYLRWLDKRYDRTRCSCSGGTSRAVQVVFVAIGRIEVHYETDVVYMYATCCNIGSYQYAWLACCEARQCALALILAEIAVDGCRLDSCPGELLGQPVRSVFCPDEEQSPIRACSDFGRQRYFVLCGEDERTVFRCLHG